MAGARGARARARLRARARRAVRAARAAAAPSHRQARPPWRRAAVSVAVLRVAGSSVRCMGWSPGSPGESLRTPAALPSAQGAESQCCAAVAESGDARAAVSMSEATATPRASIDSPPIGTADGLALRVAPGRLLRGPVHGHPRPEHRQRGAALDPVEPRLLLARPAVGRQRVRDHVRGLPAARGPRRRPARPAPDVRRGAHPVRAHLAGGRRAPRIAEC